MKGNKVSFRAAVPLVLVYAFGIALADHFAKTVTNFVVIKAEAAYEYVEDVLD